MIDNTEQERMMASRLNPYIGFSGDARQAMEFYESVFGGQLHMSTFGEFGGGDSADKDKIMHASLETPTGFTIMASDTPSGMDFDSGSRISISLSGDDGDDLRRWFERLSDGGNVTMALEKQMWGDEFGMCTDKFGVAWMVNIAGSSGQ